MNFYRTDYLNEGIIMYSNTNLNAENPFADTLYFRLFKIDYQRFGINKTKIITINNLMSGYLNVKFKTCNYNL